LLNRNELIFDSLSAVLQTVPGLTQLAVALACVALGWLFGSYVYRHYYRSHPERSERFFSYLGLRLAMPAMATLLLIGAAIGWHMVTATGGSVLRTCATLMFWMSLIRVVSAVLRQALPRGRFERGSEHLMASVLWLFYAAWAVGIDAVVLEWMTSISFTIGKTRLDLLMIVNAILWVTVIVIGALWVSRVIESRLMRVKDLDLSLRIVFSKIARTVLLVAAVLIALPVVGIDLTVLSVFGGALGVGLGFGLQKIASNYVSGFIILLDRSIRIGDNVKVDTFEGRITDIKTRYTLIRAGNGREAIVPNESLITSRVENLSLADRKFNITTTIVVGYESDVAQVQSILCEAAKAQPRVMTDPAPVAFLMNFAPDGLEFTLNFWVADPDKGKDNLRSAINIAILDGLRGAGIDIPYPQRVVRVESLPVGVAPAGLSTEN